MKFDSFMEQFNIVVVFVFVCDEYFVVSFGVFGKFEGGEEVGVFEGEMQFVFVFVGVFFQVV